MILSPSQSALRQMWQKLHKEPDKVHGCSYRITLADDTPEAKRINREAVEDLVKHSKRPRHPS